MRPEDLDFAASCTAAEGWRTQTRAEFEGFYAYDPEGCLIAEVSEPGVSTDARVGICVGTPYGGYGFIGELVVVAEARRQGIGRRLLERAIEHLRQRGAQSIYLEGVLAAVPWYERAGFRKVCRSLRFSGELEGRSHDHERAMCATDLDAVCVLDRRAFGADRPFFLKRRFVRHTALCRVVEQAGQIAAFAMAMRAGDLIAVGPWVVDLEVPRPGDLLEGIALAAPGCELGFGVLETNGAAVQAARALGFSERDEPPWRMVLGPVDDLGVSPLAYAIGSPAKG
jgi:ribosomal protein S18 acetylase RimI-like enzyme